MEGYMDLTGGIDLPEIAPPPIALFGRGKRRERIRRYQRIAKRKKQEMYVAMQVMYITRQAISIRKWFEMNIPRLSFILGSSLIVLSLLYYGSLKTVEVHVDGRPYEVVVTTSRTVGEFLRENKLLHHEEDEVSPASNEAIYGGSIVSIKRAFPVFVTVDGQTAKIWTTAGNVADLLAKEGYVLGEHDEVTPEYKSNLEPNSEVAIARIEKIYMASAIPIPYRSEYRSNASLARGVSRIVTSGERGMKEELTEVVYRDGKEISRAVVKETVVAEPQNKVIERGTRVTSGTITSREVSLLDYSRRISVVSTAYCPGTPGSGCPIDHRGRARCTGRATGRTATGARAIAGSGTYSNPHIIAVDPRVIPLRSRLYIVGYGYAVALDTGGVIKGNKIDLLFDRHQDAVVFGRRNLIVYLLN